MILGTKVEQSENSDFLGGRASIFGSLFDRVDFELAYTVQYLYRNEALLLNFPFM